MSLSASLKDRKLSDCISRGRPLREMNLRRPCRKLSVVCSLRSSKCTALVIMHVNMKMYALLTRVSRPCTSGRTNSGPAKSTPVWLNGGDSVTRSVGKSLIRSR
ncbi:hypothetical protein T11_13552 [Trichinella zimbabwensis]|uniref:Uncharacterized protein n=1 Tax=Trichinella zimbabwensis TaxID=268475 RepID=A0A0V1GX19_9BILA|nr:hypothetical protein T11_13552 [Trichinella zimbabwensis]